MSSVAVFIIRVYTSHLVLRHSSPASVPGYRQSRSLFSPVTANNWRTASFPPVAANNWRTASMNVTISKNGSVVGGAGAKHEVDPNQTVKDLKVRFDALSLALYIGKNKPKTGLTLHEAGVVEGATLILRSNRGPNSSAENQARRRMRKKETASSRNHAHLNAALLKAGDEDGMAAFSAQFLPTC